MKNYIISVGKSRTELHWQRREVAWETLLDRLSHVQRTPETVREYKSLTKPQQGRIKDKGGFVGGALSSDQRKASTIESRSLLTLDIDYGTADCIAVIDEALDGYTWALYSTHSHTPEAPRYRLIVPLSRQVTPDEYGAVSRRVAESIGMDLFDDSTYQPERLMYWPTAAIDGEYIFEHREGVALDADRSLASYADWTDVAMWPVSSRMQRVTYTDRGRKQEDPTQKTGIIGAFCRTYGIAAAITEFLPEVYAPAGKDRYTYLPGSSANGVIVYEDKWAYSHHGTDPAGGKLCNAFDLVRLHRFADLDAEADPDTPVNRLPSFERMAELARGDKATSSEIARAKLREISEDYEGLIGETETREGESTEGSWLDQLQWHNEKTRDYWLPSPFNFALICENDPKLKGLTRHDVFTDRHVLTRDTPWMPVTAEHQYWNDTDEAGLSCYMSKTYRLQGPGALTTGHDLVMAKSYYHPIRDYFGALPAWDGQPRLDTLLIDYLGAEDNPLTRAMTRKHLCAAVARVMDPGVKYDYILTIVGPEGAGKSTLCKRLAMKWFCDSFSSTDIGDKQAMEQLRGSWIIELGELKDYKHSTVEAFKAFVSKQVDEYRPAYGRKKCVIPRQCIFFATTNEMNFLKGDTGNRRFWPVEVGVDLPEKDVFHISDAEVDQIWAEALQRYRQGEPLYLPSDLEQAARARQSDHNEIEADERVGVIAEYIHKTLPSNWYEMSRQARRDFIAHGYDLEVGDPGIRREYISVMEVIEECFGQPWDRYKAKEIGAILRHLDGVEYVGLRRTPDKVYGPQKRWEIKL